MKTIPFYKLQASGNDFILIDTRHQVPDIRRKYRSLAKTYCERKFGIGADGLLVIESSAKADFKMRIFNSDGSEAQMCGNGARCAALYNRVKGQGSRVKEEGCREGRGENFRIETMAGIIEARVMPAKLDKNCRSRPSFGKLRTSCVGPYQNFRVIKMKMSDPVDFKPDLPLKVLGRDIKVNFINTGVPHTVIFVENADEIDVETIGRAVRFHKKFAPAGTNVNFVQVLGEKKIKIRTYERGVEAETLACGTGMTASAIISGYKLLPESFRTPDREKDFSMSVISSTGEASRVYFTLGAGKATEVWLQGRAYFVYKGVKTAAGLDLLHSRY